MGLTFNLGRDSAALTSDASLNVGIGAAPSGTYKFEVTGTAKVSGILTLGSTISNGTYTYTLPSATGTLALTSALGDYLPLTGGTLTGALSGTSATFSSGITTVGGSNQEITASATGDFFPRLKLIRTAGTTKTNRNYSFDIGSNGSLFLEDNTASATRLTIDTTGAATFGSTITASGNLNLQAGAVRNINFYDSSNTNINAQIQYDQISATSGQLFFGTNNAGTFATRLTIASTGAATFSSSVTMGGDLALTPTDSAIIFSSGAGRFFAGGAERLKIFSTGKIQSNSSIAGDVIADFRNTSSTGYGFAIQGGNDSGRYSLKVVNYNDSSTYFYVRGDGNVGIGTSTPLGRFDVYRAAGLSGTAAIVISSGESPSRNWSLNTDVITDGDFAICVSTTTGGTPSPNAGNTKFYITKGGVVTINALGTGTVTATSGVLSATSDMNLKIEDGFIDNALEKVMNLKPRYFLWKEETGLPTNLRQLGFYAQEVNEAIGEEGANTPKGENDKWGIYDRAIIAMLTKAMQEQNELIEDLKSRLDKAGL